MEHFDPRGGWNRYKFQVDFFKRWSDKMAYVLGFLYADGDIENTTLSSRTKYIKFTSKDKDVLEKIKLALKAEHPIHFRPPQTRLYPKGKFYTNLGVFYLRIGSRRLFADLIKFGLVPNKSKIIKFSTTPINYLGHFLRGYFDGDGTIFIEKRRDSKQRIIFGRAQTIFSSGSKRFLKTLSNVLAKILNVRKVKVYYGNRDFQIKYSTRETIEIFKFMYEKSYGLFLKRKFDIFEKFFNKRTKWLDKKVAKILKENKEYLARYPRS